MHLAGPQLLRLVFHVFVVVVGVLILSGAVNTSIIGANGVMNRAGRGRRAAGLVPQAAQALRHHLPHHQRDRDAADRSPSSLSRGDVYLLGEAYAFGVVWSFFLKSLGVLVLRYQAARPGIQVPGQLPHRRPRDSGRPGRHHAGPVPGGHRQPVLEADRHHLRRRLHRRAVRHLHHLRAASTARKRAREEGGPRGIQPRHAAGGHRRHRARAARLRAGGGPRLQPHVAPAERAARRPTCGGTTSW